MIDDLNLSNASDRHTLRLRLYRPRPEVTPEIALALLALLDSAPEPGEVSELRAQLSDLQGELADSEKRADELHAALESARKAFDGFADTFKRTIADAL